jgi:hypothetical protein
MATYERETASSIREVLRHAEEVLTARLPITKVGGDSHSVILSGADGTVTIGAHKHGVHTVVHAETDQLRTSRLDGDVQYLMTLLPYQPGDKRSVKPELPGGLSNR